MMRIMCNTEGQFRVEQRNAQGEWEAISPDLGKGKDGFYAAKERLSNAEKGGDHE